MKAINDCLITGSTNGTFFEHSKALGNSTKKTFNWNLKFSVSVKRIKEQEQVLGN